MKIKLVVYSKDRAYMEHLMQYMNVHCYEKIEMGWFSDEDVLNTYLRSHDVDVVILDGDISVGSFDQKFTTVVSRFSEQNSVKNSSEITVYKYQKGEAIYKKILDLYASGEKAGTREIYGKDENEPQFYLVLPVNGGAGASTIAKAFAVSQAEERRVLYLNLELYGDCCEFFQENGEFTLDDILYALKSKRGNFNLKLESVMRKSPEGVCFYAPAESPLNLMELSKEEFRQFISGIRECGLFDLVIMDMDMYPSEWMLEGMNAADQIWLVADGTDASNEKYQRFMQLVKVIERKNEWRLIPKMRVFYNKYRSKTGRPLEACQLEMIGGFPRYEGMNG